MDDVIHDPSHGQFVGWFMVLGLSHMGVSENVVYP